MEEELKLSGLGKYLKDKKKPDQLNFCIKCFGDYVVLKKHKDEFRFVCKGCGFQFSCFFGATSAEVLQDENCSKCGSCHVSVTYPSEISPFPGGAVNYQGCMVDNPILRDLIINPYLSGDAKKRIPKALKSQQTEKVRVTQGGKDQKEAPEEVKMETMFDNLFEDKKEAAPTILKKKKKKGKPIDIMASDPKPKVSKKRVEESGNAWDNLNFEDLLNS